MIAYDGDLTFARGQNDGLLPQLLSPGNYASGINIRCRSGGIEPRPGFEPVRFDLSSLSPEDAGAFLLGLYQGAVKFRRSWVVAAGGRVFRVHQSSGFVDIISGLYFDASANEVYLTNVADQLVLVSDGVGPLGVVSKNQTGLVLDPGATFLRPGLWMLYGMGRVWQISPDRRTVYAGNAYLPGLADEEQAYSLTESPVGFSPWGIGELTGLHFLPILDSGTGIGSLLVTGTNGVYAFDPLIPREQWGEVEVGRKVAGNFAVLSHRSLTSVNGDVYFRRAEGLGSLVSARADWQTPTNRSVSFEARARLSSDHLPGLSLVSGSYYDNTLRVTYGPAQADTGEVLFDGLLAMDIEGSSGLVQGTPVFAGADVGIRPLQLVGDCFAGDAVFARAGFGKPLELFKICRAHQQGDPGKFRYQVETRGYAFDAPALPKQIHGPGFLSISDIQDPEVEITVKFRPDNSREWNLWTTKKLVIGNECGRGVKGAAYARLPLSTPVDESKFDPVTGRSVIVFGSLQLQITVEGRCRIDQLFFSADVMDVTDDVFTGDEDVIVAGYACDTAFDYEVEREENVLYIQGIHVRDIPAEGVMVLTDHNGVPLTDPQGNPITFPKPGFLLDPEGRPLTDPQGNLISLP